MLLAVAVQAQPPMLNGVAVRLGTSDPVPYARIVLTRIDGRLRDSRASRADDRGRFTFAALSPGRYRVFAHHEAFVRTAGATIIIGDDGVSADLRIEMTPTGTISGRVLDEYGDPVPDVYVRAASDERRAETQTNDLGEYRLHSLVPGAYVISAEPYLAPRIEGSTYVVPTPPGPYSPGEGRGMMPLGRILQAGGYLHPMAVAGRSYARVYYPGGTDAVAAVQIDVTPGAVVGGIDLRITTVP